jgi:7,8-dihydropterin-6-yl-methyl-4-(beta-D-ribofuranosyl)aminobenzene 5'-phosphate synthase
MPGSAFMSAGLNTVSNLGGMRFSKRNYLLLISLLAMTLTQSSSGETISDNANPTVLRLTVVFNNVPYKPGLTTGWGFACVAQGYAKTILFDTGASGEVLLANFKSLGIESGDIDVVVLSHAHGDHTGGLEEFLKSNSNVTVYFPTSFPAMYKQAIISHGAKAQPISESQALFADAHTTGELGKVIKEQALVLDTPRGLVIITGCAHPQIEKIAAAAHNYLHKNIYLLMGGFHLLNRSESEIEKIIKELKWLGVEKVAPSHCTGEKAMALFRQAWHENYIEGGLGAVIEIP